MSALDHLSAAMAHLAQRRLLLISGAVTVALAAVLFASSGTSSLAAVADRCGQPAPDVRFHDIARGGPVVPGRLRRRRPIGVPRPAARGRRSTRRRSGSSSPRRSPCSCPGRCGRRRPGRALAVVPLVGAAFDYVENLAAWTLLVRYPEPAAWAARVLGTASAAKQVTMWASAVLVLAGLVGAGVAHLRTRRPSSDPPARPVVNPT